MNQKVDGRPNEATRLRSKGKVESKGLAWCCWGAENVAAEVAKAAAF